MTIIVPLGGLLADYVRRSGLLSTTNVRKLFNCGGFGLEAVFFIVVAYAKTAVSFMFHVSFISFYVEDWLYCDTIYFR